MTAVHEHTSAPIPELSSPLTTQEQEWVDQFMDDTTLFLGPDRDIMRSHHITSRSEFEDECIRKGVDPLQVDRIRKRLAGALDEGYEMCEAMGAAPGAKWGD
ncbi:MAG TPA: acetone carboxylase subunit alpha, partial [Mycobacterium sp.]